MNKKILYLECNSGISGDMTVGALLDLGADRRVLEEGLASLPLDGYKIVISEVFKSGLRACDFNVVLDKDNHDHDMEYLHGSGHAQAEKDTVPETHTHGDQEHSPEEHTHTHAHEHTHEEAAHSHEGHTHSHEHTHDHTHDGHTHSHDEHTHTHAHEEHAHSHGDHGHTHSHGGYAHHHHDARNLHDIIHILEHGTLTKGALDLAIRIFTVLAAAEASVHGKSIDEVHFHEVGAVDSIVDIAAAAICLDNLAPDQIIVSALSDGMGQIRCQHGIIPVPVPAVSAIAAAQNLTLKIRPIEGELVTPTGAAIAAAVRTGDTLPAEFRIRKIGLGAGKRNYPTTGVLRAMLLETEASASAAEETVLKLETNIDDCTGEALSFTMDQLMKAGALDVFYTPIYMKKNRPAWLLSVLCRESSRSTMERIIFRNTTTIGIRCMPVDRTRLNREALTVNTPWGKADIKKCTFEDETWFYPENDSVAALAVQENTGFPEMYHKLMKFAEEVLN